LRMSSLRQAGTKRRPILSQTKSLSSHRAKACSLPGAINRLATLAACARRGLEGIVSKRRNAPYRSGVRSGWIKVKTATWRAANWERWRLFEKR
jgi:ATP-dependent DNA ligase